MAARVGGNEALSLDEALRVLRQSLRRMQEAQQRTEERMARMEERMTHLVTSLNMAEFAPNVKAGLRTLDGISPTTFARVHSARPQIPAACTSFGTNPGTDCEKRDALGCLLYKAAKEGRARDVEKLLQVGADIHFRNAAHGNKTPLHIATIKKCQDATASLIAAGADANIIDDEDNTPLHYAACSGRNATLRTNRIRFLDRTPDD